MQYLFSALELLSRLCLFVVVTPILAGWFFVWMVIATAFAWFAWLIVIIILSDVPMGEALWHWFVFWPMTITGWIIGASDWSTGQASGALLHKSAEGRTSPFPGQTYPATSVMGVPSAVKPFRTATRTWNSAT